MIVITKHKNQGETREDNKNLYTPEEQLRNGCKILNESEGREIKGGGVWVAGLVVTAGVKCL